MSKKTKSHPVRKIFLVLLLSLLAFIVGFSIYLSYLAFRNDTSCLPDVQAQDVDSSLEIAPQLQAVLNDYSSEHGNVGLQATVILPDEKQWSGVSGYANDAEACLLTLEHHLYVGSVTKAFTAALVMEQVEDGTLRLEDPMGNWITHTDGSKITVKMLLRHTSGLPNYTENASFLLKYFGRPEKIWQPEELFAVVQEMPLNFEPGSQHLYSNANYIALGIILEEATGKSYGELLQRAVGEMGLERIYYPVYSQNLIMANAYDETIFNLGKRNLTSFRTSFESGAFSAGGIAASSQDAAIFFHNLYGKQWLVDETVEQMMTIIDAPDEDVPLQQGYGAGTRNLLIDGESLFGHTGTIPGYSAIAMHNPEHGFTIVVLSNVSTIEQTSLFGNLQKIMLDEISR